MTGKTAAVYLAAQPYQRQQPVLRSVSIKAYHGILAGRGRRQRRGGTVKPSPKLVPSPRPVAPSRRPVPSAIYLTDVTYRPVPPPNTAPLYFTVLSRRENHCHCTILSRPVHKITPAVRFSPVASRYRYLRSRPSESALPPTKLVQDLLLPVVFSRPFPPKDSEIPKFVTLKYLLCNHTRVHTLKYVNTALLLFQPHRHIFIFRNRKSGSYVKFI